MWREHGAAVPAGDLGGGRRKSWWEEPPQARGAGEEPRDTIWVGARAAGAGVGTRGRGGSGGVRSPWKAGKTPKEHHQGWEA